MSKPDQDISIKKVIRDEYRQKYKERIKTVRSEFDKLADDFEHKTVLEIDQINARMVPIQNFTKERWVEEIKEFILNARQLLKSKVETEDGSDTHSIVGRDSG